MANKKITKDEVFGYHIFPPFIDAYQNSFYSEPKKTLKQIRQIAESHALDWGEKSIGKCTLERKELPKHKNKLVVCCVYLYKKGASNKHYLVVTDGDKNGKYWFDNLEFVEGIILDEWDVT